MAKWRAEPTVYRPDVRLALLHNCRSQTLESERESVLSRSLSIPDQSIYPSSFVLIREGRLIHTCLTAQS